MIRPLAYTHSELTVRKYTVAQAIESAKRRFKAPVCVDSVRGRPLDEPITLAELNEIAEQIVSDSCFWGKA